MLYYQCDRRFKMVVGKILDEIIPLDIEDKEFLFDILQKRIIEEKRKAIYNNYQNDLEEYKNGTTKECTVDELFEVIK